MYVFVCVCVRVDREMSQGSGSADVELNTPNTSVNELPRSVSDVSSVPSYGESNTHVTSQTTSALYTAISSSRRTRQLQDGSLYLWSGLRQNL